jgi:hypothetical protein
MSTVLTKLRIQVYHQNSNDPNCDIVTGLSCNPDTDHFVCFGSASYKVVSLSGLNVPMAR